MIACLFCGASASADEAVDAGWEPEFWWVSDGKDHCIPEAVCPPCVGLHLEVDPDEEAEGLQLKRDHVGALLAALEGGAS